jgi:hypothetical protein
MQFGGRAVRPELTWARHVKAAPVWLRPYLEVPDDASPPLAMTPVHPESVGSLGPEAIGWVKDELGIELRWWQQLAMVRQLEVRKDGSLVWQGLVESGTRRIGKSVRLRSTALWRLAHSELFGEPQLVIHTGKDLAIVREIQRGAWTWAEARDWKVTRAIAREAIENGDHRWLARATDSVYGYDITLGMVDEGWAVDPGTVSEGIEPATLERICPQTHLTSTAHRKATSLMRTRISDALAIDDRLTLLLLWGAPDGADVGSQAVWKAASAHWSEARLQLMRAKFEKALRGEQDTELDDPDPMKGFESQYLNRWLLKAGAGGALPGWDDLKVETVPPAPERLGVAADASGTWFSLGAYGSGFVAPVERMPAAGGRAAFVARVVDVATRNNLQVVVGEKGMAGILIGDLEDEGVRVIRSSFDDLVQASADFYDAVESASISHGGMPELDAAVLASRWRKVGDRRALDVRGADISMLEAVSLARWSALAAPNYDLLKSFY